MFRKLLLAAAIAAVAVPGTAAAQRGVIVKVDRPAKLVAVAHARGAVSLVHTARVRGLRVGQKVSYAPKALRNHTFAAKRLVVKGTAKRVRVRGVVLAHRSRGYVVSASGAALLIRSHAATRRTASASDDSPEIGTQVDVTADVSSGDELEEHHVRTLGDATAGRFEGRLQSLAADAIVVAHDGVQLRIAVPSGFDLSSFAVGDEVLAAFARQTDGTLVLTSLAGNRDAAEANDEQEIEDGADDHGGAGEVEDAGDDHGGQAEAEDAGDDHGGQADDEHDDDGSSGSDSGKDD